MKVRKVRIPWVEQLAVFVGEAYYCKFVISSWKLDEVTHRFADGQIGLFVGTETDRKVATYMFVTLGRFLEQLAEKEYLAYWKVEVTNAGRTSLPPEGHGFKAGFMNGFITRLKERFDEEVRPKVSTAQTSVIVLVRRDALKKAETWMNENMELRMSRGPWFNRGSANGRERGRSAANDVNLSGKALDNNFGQKALR